MKLSKRTLMIAVLALLFGLGFWLLDSLVLNLSNHTIFMRVTFLLVCLIGAMITIRYVTQLEKAENDLQMQTASLEATVTGILIVDLQGTILWCNPAIVQMTGFQKEEIVGQYIGLFKSEAHDDTFHQQLWETVRSGKVWHGEQITRRKDGSTYYEEQTITPILNANGEVSYYFSVRQDITERKKAENALQERERELSLLMDNLPGMAYRCKNDKDWTMLFVSQGCLKLTGYPPENLINNTKISFQDLIHPDDRDRVWQEVQTSIKESKPFIIEYRIRDVTGAERYIWERGRVVRGLKTNEFVEGFMSDITKLKSLEQHLRESEERLRTIVQNMPVLLNAMDENSVFIAWNRECERVSGYSADEIIGNPGALRKLHPEPGELEEKIHRFASRERPFFGLEQELTCKDGSKRIIAWSNISNEFPIQDWYDWCIGVDVTNLKNTEKQLREEQQSLAYRIAERTAELQQALQAKDEFLATMSHELRTPLTAILGMSEILETELRGPLNERQKHYINSIRESGQHLLNLINDILDMAKIEASRLELEIEKIPVQQICESSLMFIKESAVKKSLEVKFEKFGNPESMKADPRRLKQILINLLNNAVKFTPEGGKIGLQVQEEADKNLIHFTVWDNGIGISPEDQQRLFQPFVQVESSLSRNYEGTGLGLSLVARLAKLHGGNVILQSQPKQGTRITVTLPRGDTPPENKPPHKTAPLPALPPTLIDSKKHVLLTEDNPQTVQTMLAYLEARNFETLIAHDGLEAIELANRNLPDLILMDIQMPKMNGLDAIRHLRSNPRTKNIPIIAISALAMSGDREKCLEAGADNYISKPTRFKELEKIIIALLSESKPSEQENKL